MDALVTAAGYRRYGRSGSDAPACASSEGWDRVVVQKVALLMPAGSIFYSNFYIQG